jgi:PAS domain-containing protein
MNILNHIDAILAMIGGAGGLQLFNWYRGRKQENRSDFEAIVALLKEDNARLRSEERKMAERVRLLEERTNNQEDEIRELRFRLQMFESQSMDLPLPMWSKDANGRMTYCNQAFVDMFLNQIGKQAKDYIGKTDVEFWGEKIGLPYYQATMRVLRTGQSEYFKDKAVLNGDVTYWHTLRYPRYAGKVKLGTTEIAFKEVEE